MKKIFFTTLIFALIISCNSKNQSELNKNEFSNYLITYYEKNSKTKIKPDSVTYVLKPLTEKDKHKYQIFIYEVEQFSWGLSEYSEEFRNKKEDEYQWKEDSCLLKINTIDSVEKKYYSVIAYFYSKAKTDTVNNFIINNRFKIIPLFEFYDISDLFRKFIGESGNTVF